MAYPRKNECVVSKLKLCPDNLAVVEAKQAEMKRRSPNRASPPSKNEAINEIITEWSIQQLTT